VAYFYFYSKEEQMQLHSIDAGLFKLDGGAMHGVVPKSMWAKQNVPDDNNMCTWSMRCLLVDEGDRKILIDTGMGNKQSEKFFSYFHPHGSGNLIKSISAAGFEPNDITDVFLTHLHFDHCGGAILKNGKAAFPNATYWSNENHWSLAMQPNAREKASFLKENFLPLQEMELVNYTTAKDGFQFSESIQLRIVNGHTEAMMLPLINYKGQNILFCADLLPSKAHISLPWVMGYDMQPLETLKEKKRILQQAFDNEWVLYFEHDHLNECCKLIETDRGFRGGPSFYLASIL